jgi:YD repeat-containing protein
LRWNDDLHRLTSVTFPGSSTTSYTFDVFGNRTSMTDGSGQMDYTYDDADRLTSVDPPGGQRDQLHVGRQRQPHRAGLGRVRLGLRGAGWRRGGRGVYAQGLMAGCNVEQWAAIGFTAGLSLGADLDQLPASLFHPQMKLLRSCEHQVTPPLLNESGK